jgi:uncharacterized protein RhaS with RHS repeats
MYNPQLGRFLSVDPIASNYPELTPYQFASNTPVQAIDLDGLEKLTTTTKPMMKGGAPMQAVVKKEDIYVVNYSSYKPGGLSNGPELKLSRIEKNPYENFVYVDNEVRNKRKEAAKAQGQAQINADFSRHKSNASNLLWNIGQVLPFYDAYSIATDINEGNYGDALLTGGLVLLTSELGGGKGGLNSFESIVANPKALWGKSATEVESILGEGWKKGTYGSNGQGWKYIKGDKSVFYNASSSAHGGAEYFGFSSGKLGTNKIVDPLTYLPRVGDKAKIIHK